MPTISKTRIIGEKQQIVRLDREKIVKDTEVNYEYIKQMFKKNSFSVVVLSDYGKGVCSDSLCQYIIQYANQNNIRVIIDPKGKDWEKYQEAFVITPNLKELKDVYGEAIEDNDAAIKEAAIKIKNQFHIKNMIVTRSEKGMSWIDETDQIQHFPTHAQEVFDVSGAGDTVVALIAKGLYEGLDLAASIPIANIAAGYVVSKIGTYAISKEELAMIVE